ncbi:MAG: diguanylate cyclase [Azoarcus sp.]|jgi:diguanylate cyclase (GGDEF)-like protein|nr:diguanylate cyclase [Azoarcus sp.]
MVLNSGKTLNFKVSLFFIAISVTLTVVLTAISLYAFRQFSINTATEHLRTAAEITRIHLTEAMITGVIDQRERFLSRLSETQNLKSARVVRAPVIDQQFGIERKGEYLPDDIERNVIKTGQSQFEISDNNGEIVFRGTIPYAASNEGNPNCLQCHSAQPGAVLGAITMTMSVTALRHNGLVTVINIIGTVLVALFVLFILLYCMLRPISDTASAIEHAVQDALDGNFRNELKKQTNDEIGQIASDMNRLLKFLDSGLNKINSYISQLIVRQQKPGENLLLLTINMVKNMMQISQYKIAIEEDDSKLDVYRRLIATINNRFFQGKGEFSIYEVSNDGTELHPISIDGNSSASCRWCQHKILTDPQNCRVFHTAHMINGITQPDICYNFKQTGLIDLQDDEWDDVIDIRQQLVRAQLQRRLRGLDPGRVQKDKPVAQDNDKTANAYYPLCFPILKSGAVGSVVQLVVRDTDKDRILEALPYIRVYLSDTAPVLEVHRLMETLKESTLRDPMTGLNNRRFLEEYIDTITANVRRKQTHVAILMLDLDHFKMVNDTYGHDAGDAVLKALSHVIKFSVRASDIVIRYGGEEFMVVLQETSISFALCVAEKIRASVQAMQINHGGVVLQKTISIGISDFPGNSNTFWQAVKFADVALYHAKEAGRNRVMQFKPEMWSDTQEY